MEDELKTRHGRDKPPAADDPRALVATPVPGGEPETMATCLIEEYARLGLDAEEIFELFRRPFYQTHAFYRCWGEARMRHLIEQVLLRSGRLRVSVRRPPPLGGCDA